MAIQSPPVVGEDQHPTPDVLSVSPRRLTAQDWHCLEHLARLNNVILHRVPAESASLRDPTSTIDAHPRYRIMERRMFGLNHRVIRVAEDITRDEFSQMVADLNPHYSGRPLEEVLFLEGMRSLLQIHDPAYRFTLGDTVDEGELLRGLIRIKDVKFTESSKLSAERRGDDCWFVRDDGGNLVVLRYTPHVLPEKREISVYSGSGDSTTLVAKLRVHDLGGGEVAVFDDSASAGLSSNGEVDFHTLFKGVMEAKRLLRVSSGVRALSVRAGIQARALDEFSGALRVSIPFGDPDKTNWQAQSPRRIIHHGKAVCEEMSLLSHTVLSAINPPGSGLRVCPAHVILDEQGRITGHVCLMAQLADGGYYLFDTAKFDGNGLLPHPDVPPHSISWPDGDRPSVEVNLPQKKYAVPAGFLKPSTRMILVEPVRYFTAVQIMNVGWYLKNVDRLRPEDENLDLAAEQFRRSLEIFPQNHIASINLTLALMRKGDPASLEQAGENVTRLIGDIPEYQEGHSFLGRVFFAGGDVSSALGEARKDPTQGYDYHVLMGLICGSRSGFGRLLYNPDQALLHFKQAIQLFPGSYDAHYLLGRAYQERGDDQNATPSYRSFLEHCPPGAFREEQESVRKWLKSKGITV